MGPRVESLSNYQVTAGQNVWAYGAGFTGVKKITVGDAEATEIVCYEDNTIGFHVPKQPGGSSHWVQITGADGSVSQCVSNAQLLTYLDEVFDQPRGQLRLDSITPSPVTVGRADSYWVLGSGLSATSVVVMDGHSCDFETHDDERLVIHVPQFHHPTEQTSMRLRVHTAHTQAELEVACVSLDDVVPEDHAPAIGHLEPTQLPASGGKLTLWGAGLNGVTHVDVGLIAATIDEVHADHIVVTVPSLADHVHEELNVVAVTPHAGTPTIPALTMLRVTAD
ncbi:MAG: hypothetical protein QOI15_1709 [Pseudonocardiales bacterium]|jgi:hypothetical protein|nr:hypothetical protein [Pseudonocardiales bacterium]